MTQNNAFTNVQAAMNLANTGEDILGALVIISGVFTEFALADLLHAEARKIEVAVLATPTNVEDLTSLDDSVANVLDHVCCIEKQIVEKIKQGRYIMNGVAPY